MPNDVFPLDWSLSVEERTEKFIRLLEAGILGEPNDHPDSSPEIQELYFETVERTVDHSAVNGTAR